MPQAPETPPDHAALQGEATAWFATLRDRLCAAFESIEDSGGVLHDREPGRFTLQPWSRDTLEGGGTIGLMHGRVFEKVGVNVSVVAGEFSPEFRASIPGAAETRGSGPPASAWSPTPHSPRVPAAHMNTRMIVTTRGWFGGGGDITPMVPGTRRRRGEDAATLPRRLPAPPATRTDPAYYPEFKAWVRPLLLPAAPQRAAWAGGASSTTTSTGGEPADDFAFTRDVGLAFLEIIPRHRAGPHGRTLDGPAEARPPVGPAAAATWSSTCCTDRGTPVRLEDGRQRGGHPDEPATGSALALT